VLQGGLTFTLHPKPWQLSVVLRVGLTFFLAIVFLLSGVNKTTGMPSPSKKKLLLKKQTAFMPSPPLLSLPVGSPLATRVCVCILECIFIFEHIFLFKSLAPVLQNRHIPSADELIFFGGGNYFFFCIYFHRHIPSANALVFGLDVSGYLPQSMATPR